MKTACVTFTYPKDLPKALLTQQGLPEDWEQIWVIEARHYDAMLPQTPKHVKLLCHEFDRGRTLRGAKAIEGMRALFLELGKTFDAVVKKDSDCRLFVPNAWTAPIELGGADFVYIRRSTKESRMLCNGCCYAMSKNALENLRDLDCSADNPDIKRFLGHEDLIFSHFFTCIKRDLFWAQINKNRVHWWTRPYYSPDVICAHYGYIDAKQTAKNLQKHLQLIKGKEPHEISIQDATH